MPVQHLQQSSHTDAAVRYNLRRVYASAAAQDFLSRDRTTEALQRHVQGTRRIKDVLDARLSTLREADRPGDAG